MTHSLHSARKRGRGLHAGFTLIELLVVVLIIGILAAVAVPQYEAAVTKSRFMSFMPTVRAITDAQERYYMANGKYAFNLYNLDIQIPAGCKIRSSIGEGNMGVDNEVLCGEDWLLDNVSQNLASKGYFRVSYCPGQNEKGSNSCPAASDVFLNFYFKQYPEKGGRFECHGRTDKGKKLCKTFNGVFN